MMKRRFGFVLTMIMILSLLASACAGGYTLPQKMFKQLQVGSGLTGSFVIHGNADQNSQPLLNILQNTEFEIVGIKSDGYLHYHIFQSVDSDSLSVPAEFLGLDGKYYFRSSFFDEAYTVPEANQVINLLLNIHGENPPVFAQLLKMLIKGDDGDDGFDTSTLEKKVDLWISGYTPETTFLKDEESVPKLKQVFTIPVESMYHTICELIQYVSQNDSAMSILRSFLSEDEISLYFNPDLSWYYLEALGSLDMKESIVFTRTVSTLGELLESTITLPLDESRTGYSSVTIHNDDQRKEIRAAGAKGFVLIDMPLEFSLAEKETDETIRFALIRPEGTNLSLKISVKKTHEEHNDPEETRTYETDSYKILMEHDESILPEGISSGRNSAAETIEAEIELRYSSKTQLYSSPTTLEFSASISQGAYHYDVAGKVKTASPEKVQNDYPWAFERPDPASAVGTDTYSFADFAQLIARWIGTAGEQLVRTPEEIRQTTAE